MIKKQLTVTATTIEELDTETSKLEQRGWQPEGHAYHCRRMVLEEEGEVETSFPYAPLDVGSFSKPVEDLNAQIAAHIAELKSRARTE